MIIVEHCKRFILLFVKGYKVSKPVKKEVQTLEEKRTLLNFRDQGPINPLTDTLSM